VSLCSCGPPEAPEAPTTESREWAKDFAEDRNPQEEKAKDAVPFTEEDAVNFAELDRRIMSLSSGQVDEATEELDELAVNLRRGIRMASLRGQREREAAYRVGLGLVYRRLGFTEPALDILEAVPALVKSGSGALWASAALRLQGDILRDEGRFGGALEAYDRALQTSASNGLWDRAYRTVDTIEALCRNPDTRPGIRALFGAGGELAGRKDLAPLGGFCNYVIRVSESPGSAYPALQAAAARAREVKDRPWLVVILARVGLWELEHGMAKQALSTYSELSAYQYSMKDKVGFVDTLLRFAAAHEYAGERDADANARSIYKMAVKTAREIDDRRGEATALNYLGLSYIHGANQTLGLACLLEADRIAADIAPDSRLSAEIEQNLDDFRKMVGGQEVYERLEERVKPNIDSLLGSATAM